MALLPNSDASTAALKDDITALRADFSALMQHLKMDATNGLNSATSQIDEGARDIYRSMPKRGQKSARMMNAQVEEQPVAAMLIAAGIGFIAGRLFAR